MRTQRNSADVEQGRNSLLANDALADMSLPTPRKYNNIMLSVCSFILVTEFCERLTFYGLSGSLPVFWTQKFGLSTALATELNSLFSAVNYLTPLVGAYVADVMLGRFATIGGFCIVYVAGLAMCVVAAYPTILSQPLFFIGLFGFVALGAGGIKPNVVVLGADQFDLRDPEQRKQKDSFFNWFYWSINVGATFSFIFLTNLATNGMGAIPERDGFFASFAIPLGAFVLAIIAFFAGSSRYTKNQPQGSVLTKFFGVVIFAAKRTSDGFWLAFGAAFCVPVATVITIASYFVDPGSTIQQALAITGMVLILGGLTMFVVYGQRTEWVDVARKDKGGPYDDADVDDVADVVRVVPYLAFIVAFWAIYGQMSNNFLLQGCQMNIRLGTGKNPTQLNAATLNCFDSSVILVFIPLFDKFLYPSIERAGIRLTVLRKIGTGFFFCILSMTVAGVIEISRKDAQTILYTDETMPPSDLANGCATVVKDNKCSVSLSKEGNGECHCSISESSSGYLTGCTDQPLNDISIWFQSFQFLLIGIGEIFTSISSYELFYSEVPESMRSVCQALNLLATCLGSFITGALNSVFVTWLPDNLNNGKLNIFFFVLAFLMFLNLLAFMRVSPGFKYKDQTLVDERVPSRRELNASRLSNDLGRSSFSNDDEKTWHFRLETPDFGAAALNAFRLAADQPAYTGTGVSIATLGGFQENVKVTQD
eukprot:g1255.t1